MPLRVAGLVLAMLAIPTSSVLDARGGCISTDAAGAIDCTSIQVDLSATPATYAPNQAITLDWSAFGATCGDFGPPVGYVAINGSSGYFYERYNQYTSGSTQDTTSTQSGGSITYTLTVQDVFVRDWAGDCTCYMNGNDYATVNPQ